MLPGRLPTGQGREAGGPRRAGRRPAEGARDQPRTADVRVRQLPWSASGGSVWGAPVPKRAVTERWGEDEKLEGRHLEMLWWKIDRVILCLLKLLIKGSFFVLPFDFHFLSNFFCCNFQNTICDGQGKKYSSSTTDDEKRTQRLHLNRGEAPGAGWRVRLVVEGPGDSIWAGRSQVALTGASRRLTLSDLPSRWFW